MTVNIMDVDIFISLGYVNVCCFQSLEAMCSVYCSP
jgi:hypothetical protein